MTFKIGILNGDGIGLEVVPESVKVMTAAADRAGLELAWSELPVGEAAHAQYGTTIPDDTVAALKNQHGFILGPFGHAAYPQNDPTWVFPPLRKMHDLFASVKPVKSYSNIASVHKNVDIVFVREVTEGMQSADGVLAGTGELRPNNDTAIGLRVITRRGSSRVAHEAFEIARRRPKKRVTAVHKAAVYKQTCGMFAEECRAAADNYPDVTFDEIHIDTIAAHLVMDPQDYDVIVTTNQFGDILTDLGAGLVGGLGLAPGLCVGDNQAMAQATHGSAPDIAGKGIADPYAMVMSGKMLIEWLGRKHGRPEAIETAKLIDTAIERVIANGKHLTMDLGGEARTSQMGDAIVAAMSA